jgi:hypothetical protein
MAPAGNYRGLFFSGAAPGLVTSFKIGYNNSMDINEKREKFGKSNRFSHLSDEQKHVLYKIVKRDGKKYQQLAEALQKSVDKAIQKEQKGKGKEK